MPRKPAKSFGDRFDALASMPNPLWTNNSELAAYIRKTIPGLGMTNRVQVSRWRNGLTAPHTAVQELLLAFMETAVRPVRVRRARRRRGSMRP